MTASLPSRADVVVVGAGTAGAACALSCARRGLRVLCLDRKPLAEAGARWINGVPARAFEAAGIAPPTGAELRGRPSSVHVVVAGEAPSPAVVVAGHEVLEVDVRLLVARLQRSAQVHGADVRGDVTVHEIDTASVHTDRGTVRARWIVDASGLGGARCLASPPVASSDICVAAQEVRRVTDQAACEAFFARHGVPLGHVLAFTGVAGGFSTVHLRCHGDEIDILTGSIPANGHPAGDTLLREFVDRHRSWLGERCFGGGGRIPLRRPYDRLADGRIALLGDAACQVYPPNGSGTGAGLVAARTLADALADGDGPGGYAVAWQRRYGGVLAAYVLFRRFSQRLDVTDLRRLMRSRTLDPEAMRDGLAQRFPRAPARRWPRLAVALAREPRLGGRLAAVITRMAAARALYRGYPRDPARLGRWSRRVARLFGVAPDVS